MRRTRALTVGACRTSEQRRRGLRKLLIRSLIIGALSSIVLFVILVRLAFQPSEVPLVQADSSVARTVEYKVEQAKTAAINGHPQVVSLDESELNSLIKAKLALLDAQPFKANHLRDLRVQLVDDRIGVYLGVEAYGQKMTLDVVGTLRSVNGYIQFEPISGKIGRVPIPSAALKEAVREALSSPASIRDLQLPRELADLKVESGKLLVTYR
ncbi:MAG TPA: hypothetical protein VGA01_12365 [Candidatus Binatia bacterium]